ncbi:hypothetical protein, partial [Thermus scotoductus]|uniref:hypothetical protein n=1 Tax=Thermus scotoductus TaxID=37636 RepID=UPI001C12AE30
MYAQVEGDSPFWGVVGRWFNLGRCNPFYSLWTVFGILLHLSFAILMGLVTFSAVMISLLLFTLGDKEWALLA